MIRTVIAKHIRLALSLSKSAANSRKFLSYNTIYKKCDKSLVKKLFVSLKNEHRSISYSNRTKSDSKSNESPEDELNKNALSDDDFQNILKDFAQDFGLNDESQKILEDIKNSFDDNDEHNPLSSSQRYQNTMNSTVDKTKHKLGEKFIDFSEYDSLAIPSHEELQDDENPDVSTYHVNQRRESPYPTELKRGITGVFDVDELVKVLHQENVVDVAVIAIHVKNLADYMVLGTVKSPRHSKAVGEYVLKLYKMKKHTQDPFIKIEGEDVASWKVLDMGNIFLHLMLAETRSLYDLESLWLLHPEFDSGGTAAPDPLLQAMQEQVAFFNNLQDASAKDTT